LPNIKAYFENLIEQYNDVSDDSTAHLLLQIKPGSVIAEIEVWKELAKTSDETVSDISFSELEDYEWAKDSIEALAKSGYINGKGDTKFAPGDSITREEFVAMIMRVFDFNKGIAGSDTFQDVSASDWYAEYVGGAVETGIITGIGNTVFGAGTNITRQDAATVIIRAVDAAGKLFVPKKSAMAFTDVNLIDDYAYSSITELTRAGVINGVSSDKFAPLENLTRAEAAVMLMRTIINMQ